MNSSLQTFARHVAAVDALQQHFADRRQALAQGETPTQYEFNAAIETPAWLRQRLFPLADVLLPARFRLTLVATVQDYRATLQVVVGPAGPLVDCESAETVADSQLGSPPPAAAPDFQTLQNRLQAGASGLSLADVVALLEQLAAGGATISLALRLFLDKNPLNRRLAAAAGQGERPKVVSFLFAQALIDHLQGLSLATFEEEFCQYGRRTVIPLFDFAGCLSSDLLAICGRGHEAQLEHLLAEPPAAEALQRAQKTLDFRQSQGFWAFPTAWLTPDLFAIPAETVGSAEAAMALHRQLRGYQALLAAIFLADQVDFADGRYWVEYRGLGRARLPLQRATLLAHEDHLDDLFRLYVYAYDGFSIDKAEIAQQFLSLIAVTPEALCRRAGETLDATRKTYEEALVARVKDYFEARQKIQERLKTAVAETSNTVIGLTRDVSADLYKVAGIVAAAFAGALLKPDISAWAALAAASAIAIYMAIVIFYYLASLQHTYDLRMAQHRAYIRSFDDTLAEQEIEDFLQDEHLLQARQVFTRKRTWAIAIYAAFLTVALAIAASALLAAILSALQSWQAAALGAAIRGG